MILTFLCLCCLVVFVCLECEGTQSCFVNTGLKAEKDHHNHVTQITTFQKGLLTPTETKEKFVLPDTGGKRKSRMTSPTRMNQPI